MPRGKSPNPLRERNARVNTLVQAELASLSHASFLDVDPGFIQSDGSISHQDLYDYLHLTAQAYQKVCQPIFTRIKALLEAHAPWGMKANKSLYTIVDMYPTHKTSAAAAKTCSYINIVTEQYVTIYASYSH